MPTGSLLDACPVDRGSASVVRPGLREAMPQHPAATVAHETRQAGRWGLHTLTFFWACALGGVGPFLSPLLAQRHWRYDSIGMAMATISIGVSLLQTPAGMIADRTHAHRGLLIVAAAVVGLGYTLLPLVSATWLVFGILLIVGAAQAFYAPLQGALAFRLSGAASLTRTVGRLNACNQLGNIAAALGTLSLVTWSGIGAPFRIVGLMCLAAMAATCGIQHPGDGLGPVSRPRSPAGTGLRHLLHLPQVPALCLAALLYGFVNGPMLSLAALYIRHQHGSNGQVAALVLVAQAAMIPVSLIAGRLCDRWGRKSTLILATVCLTVRVLLYALVRTPDAIVAIQVLDGLAAGLYGVAIVAMVADLAGDNGHFNALNGLVATAASTGGIAGPIVTGILLQRFGFTATFVCAGAVAAVAALVLHVAVAETRPGTAIREFVPGRSGRTTLT